MPAQTEAQKRAKSKYRKEKVKRTYIEFYGTDTDLWDHLEKQVWKQTYLKDLIREDMKKKQS